MPCFATAALFGVLAFVTAALWSGSSRQLRRLSASLPPGTGDLIIGRAYCRSRLWRVITAICTAVTVLFLVFGVLIPLS